MHFLVGDERAMHARRNGRARAAGTACRRARAAIPRRIWSRMVRESTFAETWNAMRVGMFALMRPVITSTEGRCVARIR